jgi:hypothetical protein
MRKLLWAALLFLLTTGLWAQSAPPATDDAAQLRQEIDQLKKTVNALEQRLDAQEKAKPAEAAPTAAPAAATKQDPAVAELQESVRDLNDRVMTTERRSLKDRLDWGGDYRFEAHTIWGTVPNHYDGMQLQNLMVKTLWLVAPTAQGGLGWTPQQLQQQMANGPDAFAGTINTQLQQNYSQYQFFSGNLTFPALKQAIGQFPPQMQNQLMQFLMGVTGVYQAGYTANTNALLTNRLRLKFETKIADNISFGARLSMYKVFGDSTGVQVFNGQPTSLNIDGTTAGVPNSDQVRVERVFFNWNNIGGSKLYLSIGRRPANYGPPLNYRDDDLRGGTPSGALFDFQYDGMTVGYHVTDKMTLRACYGLGYSSGFGNGNLLKTPADRLKDVHLAGGVMDLYETDHTFVQALVARAWNVTDGFNGLVVMPNNPLTGDPVPAPVVMRYTPSANLGAIDLYGIVLEKKLKQFDLYASANWDSLRPNGETTPFGGLGSDPFSTPVNHEGQMYYVGVRYAIPKDDGRTKIGFEFNHGSKYWFNFSNAEDDIIAPKTNTRGEVYETYLTHRIADHFMFKADFIRYNYTWSGSGWHIGEPKRLDSNPLLGFPGYDKANMFTVGLTSEF